MSLTSQLIDRLRSHWAVRKISESDFARSTKVVNERLAARSVGDQINFAFQRSKKDDALLRRVALACRIAVTEGLDSLSGVSEGDLKLREQASAGAYCAFDILRLLPIPKLCFDQIFHVLEISSLAYCGERWSDLRRWYTENNSAMQTSEFEGEPWDRRLLYRIYDCWVRMFRKDGWEDLNGIQEVIAGLRKDQDHYEREFLGKDSSAENQAKAIRLFALYHWARATEILALYLTIGDPPKILTQIDEQFEYGVRAAEASRDYKLEMILRWLHAAARIMTKNSLWWATRSINSKTTSFVESITSREHRPMFELLPPQKAALHEQGLLDQAKTAVVINLPTSGGKTLLAQFRILQALNQFQAEDGWVAYVAPTRALVAQVTRRLRRDFTPIGIKVEQLTAAVDIDAFEDQLLRDKRKAFDVIVATPEKLSLVIRNSRITRTLALLVLDEAQNIEAEGRGLRIELLLATIKRDCTRANFLLLMPFVENPDAIARWLAQDSGSGGAISMATSPWKPNERIVGLYRAVQDESVKAGWRLEYETLSTTPGAMPLAGVHRVGGARPIPSIPRSSVIDGKGKQVGLSKQTAAIASILANRRARDFTSIAGSNRTDTAWSMARLAVEVLPKFKPIPDPIQLVQDFLKTEISPDFELVSMLNYGVGVHHAGLPNDVRTLMEWLTEIGSLRVLCATSTIYQGLDFPVSSVFLSSRFVYQGGRSIEIGTRDFWNLVGRAGRIGHDSIGVVGLAEGADRTAALKFVNRKTGALVSRLVRWLEEVDNLGNMRDLSRIIQSDQWADFRCYIAHLCAQVENLDAVIAESDQLLRHTYGYTELRTDPRQRDKARALLRATRDYASKLLGSPGIPKLSDSTGFSPEGVKSALANLGKFERSVKRTDWEPSSLFGKDGKMNELYGVMLRVPQLRENLEKVGGEGQSIQKLAEVTCDWVNGYGWDRIANRYFCSEGSSSDTDALTAACKAINREIVNYGSWGVSALSQLAHSKGENLTDVERRKLNALPAMIYHGVRSENAVLMRMNSAPRSVAERLGTMFGERAEGAERQSIDEARSFLKQLGSDEWNRVRPGGSPLSGEGYRRVWKVLSGEVGT